MNTTLRILNLIVIMGVALAAPVARAASYLPGSDAKWRIYHSPHFELFSQTNESDSRGFLHNLELLHALFFARSGEAERQPKELTVYYFKSRRDYAAYLPPQLQNAGAMFQGGADRSVILLAADSTGEEAQSVLYRAYVYHLFDVVEERPTPWYRAGLAEFFSTLEIKGHELRIGRANSVMIRELRGQPFPPPEELFDLPPAGSIARVQYDRFDIPPEVRAQGWALIHYFQAGHAGLDLRQLARFELYLRSVRDNYDAGKAADKFRELCGVDYATLRSRVTEYLRSGTYRMTLIDTSIIPPASTYTREEATPAQMEVRLGELLLRTTHSPLGKQPVAAAAARVPPEIRALEALGNDALADNDITRATEYWQAAVDAGSKNPALFRELARFATARWFRQFDYDFRMSDERVAELRAMLQKSIAVAPNQQAAYVLLAWVEASSSAASPANIQLIQEHFPDLGEHRPWTLLGIALTYAHRQQFDEALRLLDFIEKLEPSPDMLPCVQYSRERISKQARKE